MPAGRPTKYAKEIADNICARLAMGETLRSICRRHGFPDESTVRLWAREDRGGFYPQYARARDIGLDVMADDLLDIADDGNNDYVVRTNEDGSEYENVDHEHIARSRLRVDARKWYLCKLAPKRYGDKQQMEHTGSVKIERIERTIKDVGD